MTDIKYVHTTEYHNTDAAEEIVPYIVKLLSPKSLIDVGCGLGTFASVFKKYGVPIVKGLDGTWVDRQQLLLAADEFEEVDLEKPIVSAQRYDLVVSLEVAEHLSDNAAATFVESLTSLGDIILFSAAIPSQGGQNHVNEQWTDYWTQLFAEQGYRTCDVLRTVFWDNKKISWWYKQNMLLVIKNGVRPDISSTVVKNLVHPELFMHVVKQRNALWQSSSNMEALIKGEFSLKTYFILLQRAISNSFRGKATLKHG